MDNIILLVEIFRGDSSFMTCGVLTSSHLSDTIGCGMKRNLLENKFAIIREVGFSLILQFEHHYFTVEEGYLFFWLLILEGNYNWRFLCFSSYQTCSKTIFGVLSTLQPSFQLQENICVLKIQWKINLFSKIELAKEYQELMI